MASEDTSIIKPSNWIKGIFACSIETTVLHCTVKNKKHQGRGLRKKMLHKGVKEEAQKEEEEEMKRQQEGSEDRCDRQKREGWIEKTKRG